MESSTPNRINPSRPARFHCVRVLAVTVLAAGTAVAALAPVTAAAGASERSASDPSTCVMQALGRYFTGLTTPARGTICPSDHGPFDPGFGQPAASR
jgi:hypothetical protein